MSPVEYTVVDDYIIFTDEGLFLLFNKYMLICYLHDVDDNVKMHMQVK